MPSRTVRLFVACLVAALAQPSLTASPSEVDRKSSPTLGQSPPPWAVVICDDAEPVDETKTRVTPRLTPDDLLMEGATTTDPARYRNIRVAPKS